MAPVPGLNPNHTNTWTHINTQTKTNAPKHIHLLSPRVGSAAVPVGSLCDWDHKGQNKVYTICRKIGCLKEDKCKWKQVSDISKNVYNWYGRTHWCISNSAVMLLKIYYKSPNAEPWSKALALVEVNALNPVCALVVLDATVTVWSWRFLKIKKTHKKKLGRTCARKAQ